MILTQGINIVQLNPILTPGINIVQAPPDPYSGYQYSTAQSDPYSEYQYSTAQPDPYSGYQYSTAQPDPYSEYQYSTGSTVSRGGDGEMSNHVEKIRNLFKVQKVCKLKSYIPDLQPIFIRLLYEQK